MKRQNIFWVLFGAFIVCALGASITHYESIRLTGLAGGGTQSIGVDNSGLIVAVAGGDGIPVLAGSGTNTILYRNSNPADPSTARILFDGLNGLLQDANSTTIMDMIDRELIDENGQNAMTWADGSRTLANGGGTALSWDEDVLANGRNLSKIGTDLTTTAAGTAATIDNSMDTMDFGTTDPVSQAPAANAVYFFSATGTLKYNAATFAANQTCTIQVVSADGGTVQASQVITTRIITTVTDGLGTFALSGVYTANSVTDTLAIQGQLSANPSAGSVQCVSAKITVIRIQ